MSWIRKNKKYSKPKKLHDSVRREEENITQKKYGLKNKKEIWKIDSKLKKIKNRAKELITKPEEQGNFLEKLKKMGLKVDSIEEVLALTKDDLLDRRLQSLVYKKGIAKSAKGARQMVVHKKILVNEKVVNIPSYIVPIELEDSLGVRIKQKKENKQLLENFRDKVSNSAQESKDSRQVGKTEKEVGGENAKEK